MPEQPDQITFDSYNLQDNTVITEHIDGDDSLPQKATGVYELPILHGAKRTFEKYMARYITLKGIVKSPTASGLIGKLEELKELFSRQEKSLQITYPDSYTRIYTASVEDVKMPRPAYAVTVANYEAKFVCPEPWSVRTNNTISGVYNISDPITTLSVGISGTLDPQPQIFFNTTASGSKFIFANTTTGKSIEISTTFSGSGRSLIIDCYNFSVQLDGNPTEFRGTFPQFKANQQNSISIITIGQSGDAKDQYFEDTTNLKYVINFGKNRAIAQSFIPTKAKLLYVELFLGLNSTYAPSQNYTITVEIQTDSSNKPSSTVVGTAVIAPIESKTLSWYRAIFASPLTLTIGSKYWIVIKAPNTVSNHTYKQGIYLTSQIAGISGSESENQGATWFTSDNYELLFRTFTDLNIILSGKLVIQYNPRRL